VCGNVTPTESLQTNFTKFTKIYKLQLKMDDDDDDIIITATCLFSPQISAILAHVSSFSSSVAFG